MTTRDLMTLDVSQLAAINGGITLDFERMSRYGDDLSRRATPYGAAFGTGAGAVVGAVSTPMLPVVGAVLGAGVGFVAGAAVASTGAKLGGVAYDAAKQVYEQVRR